MPPENDSPRVLRVALDIPGADSFDYLWDEDRDGAWTEAIGRRALVPLGRRTAIGVVVDAGPARWEPTRLKRVHQVLTDVPALGADTLRLARFAAEYYQRGIGETLIQSLPIALRTAATYRARATRAARETHETHETRAAGRRPVASPPRALAIERALARLARAADDAAHLGRGDDAAPLALTAGQTSALEVLRATGASQPVMLHGVTGSGKTEVYLQRAHDVLARGGQVLVLVPEINLTPPLLARVAARFGASRVVALHSALSDGQRLEAWLACALGQAAILVGTRIAVFAPLPRLGLIVVDEEHDGSYKQQEGLRYSARDLAVWRARDRAVPIVLGSATPSLETWTHALRGRYARAVIDTRARAHAALPAVELVDTAHDRPQAGLTARVADALRETLARGEQSLVFLNRRGYAPVLACGACGWVATCTHCSAHIVFHKADGRLHCHHCGATTTVPRACPTCGNQDLAPLGRGTQRIEEALAAVVPHARLARIDADSTRRKGSASELFARVHAGEIDVLLGTQMISKGHDFERVSLVCVLGADAALFSHDFRAPERLFQQLMQVAGRSGRATLPGRVLIQTRYAQHPLFTALMRHDFAAFATAELDARREARLPPFSFQALLRAEARTFDAAQRFLLSARDHARTIADGALRIYDVVPMRLVRRAGVERAQLLVEADRREVLQRFLPRWRAHLDERSAVRDASGVSWHLEVDPLDI